MKHKRYIKRRATPLHTVWKNIKQRCLDTNHPAYHRYGGRGIVISPEWLRDFDAFADYALLHGYAEGLTIDRIDNDGHYEPDNIRFVTLSDNILNRTSTSAQRASSSKSLRDYWEHRKASGIGGSPKSKPVRCVDTGDVLPSAADVARLFMVSRTSVSRAVKTGGRVKGFRFELA